MELLKRVFDGEIKEIDKGERTLTAYVSTNARDRMDEVLDPAGVDLTKFKKNPVVLFAHDYSSPPIGKALWIKKDGDGILSKVQFANTAFAEEIFQLYQGGFMKAFSVGFIPKDYTDGDGEKSPRRTYNKWELLEYSAVPVPANPEALALSIQKGILTDKHLKELMGVKEDMGKATFFMYILADGTGKTFFDNEFFDFVEKPYPNEHACRINDPGKYDKFARKNCEMKSNDKCIDVIYGIKDDNAEIQAFRYPKDTWDADTARSHCKSHDGSFTAAGNEDSEKEHCIPCEKMRTYFKRDKVTLQEVFAEVEILASDKLKLENDILNLKYKLLEKEKKPQTLSEITDEQIQNIIKDQLVGVIRKTTGKVN